MSELLNKISEYNECIFCSEKVIQNQKQIKKQTPQENQRKKAAERGEGIQDIKGGKLNIVKIELHAVNGDIKRCKIYLLIIKLCKFQFYCLKYSRWIIIITS
jgi:hypothetical protein